MKVIRNIIRAFCFPAQERKHPNVTACRSEKAQESASGRCRRPVAFGRGGAVRGPRAARRRFACRDGAGAGHRPEPQRRGGRAVQGQDFRRRAPHAPAGRDAADHSGGDQAGHRRLGRDRSQADSGRAAGHHAGHGRELEITKGPNSSFAGRGSAGGAINAITKQATLDYDFAHLSGSVGTDNHYRATLDMNRAFSDTFALRANGATWPSAWASTFCGGWRPRRCSSRRRCRAPSIRPSSTVTRAAEPTARTSTAR